MTTKTRSRGLKPFPRDWWRHAKVQATCVESFRHSLCFLRWRLKGAKIKSPGIDVVSGFLLYYKARCWLVTAGHVIATLHKYLSDESVSKQIELIEGRQHPHPDAATIPICLTEADLFGVDEESGANSGLDFGFIRLSPLVVDNMRRNGTRWIDAKVRLPSPVEVGGMYIVGVPLETVRRTSAFESEFDLYCLPVSANPGDSRAADYPQSIWGTLLSLGAAGERLDSIEGMSGGPVFQVERRDFQSLGFRLVGIQSAWYKESQAIRITSLERMVRALDKVLAEAKRAEFAKVRRVGRRLLRTHLDTLRLKWIWRTR